MNLHTNSVVTASSVTESKPARCPVTTSIMCGSWGGTLYTFTYVHPWNHCVEVLVHRRGGARNIAKSFVHVCIIASVFLGQFGVICVLKILLSTSASVRL